MNSIACLASVAKTQECFAPNKELHSLQIICARFFIRYNKKIKIQCMFDGRFC